LKGVTEIKKIHFKGLAEVRAIAALLVLFHHIELYKQRDGLLSLYSTKLKYFIGNAGANAVFVFFVLSGFLITYLLLSEKVKNGRIDIKKFYFRRILRIWPLYFLIVIISFLIIPVLANNIEALQNETMYYSRVLKLQDSYFGPLILFLLFLPNLALSFYPAVVGAAQSWSVGVEEQFYMVWPHLIDKIKNKKKLFVVLIFISCLPVFPIILKPLSNRAGYYFKTFNEILPIYLMGIGAIGAYLNFYYHSKVNVFVTNKIVFIMNSLFLVFLFFVPFEFYLKGIIFGFSVALQLLCIIQSGFKINLRSDVLKKAGNISYGIYMYHPIVMYACFSFFNSVLIIENTVLYNIAIYSSILFFTVFISQFSFMKFESKFIALKNKKYTVIKSG